MKNQKKIILPGMDYQLNFCKKGIGADSINKILVLGSSSEIVSEMLAKNFNCLVELVVEDYESLINSKMLIENTSNVSIRLMNFDSTDFSDNQFDLIYAQASISGTNRNKIIKEIKQILKPGGFLCVGEIVSLKKDYPAFIRDVFNASSLLPLFIDDLENYYTERNFRIIAKENFSNTLKEYYLNALFVYEKSSVNLDVKEKSYYKKVINKLKHESNVYLKLGGDKYIGFVALLCKLGAI